MKSIQMTMRKFQFVSQGLEPRVYHAETQNSWAGSEARDTHGKKQQFNVSESAGQELNQIRSF